MNKYFFGVGDGRLTRSEIHKREVIAARHGAEFVAIHPDSCKCGHGCQPNRCPVLHYWFEVRNRGAFNSLIRRGVIADLTE